MKEGISTKVVRIINGTFNNAVKHTEGEMSERMMNEVIGEINSVVHDVQSELGKIATSIHVIQRQMNANQSKHDELDDQIWVALKVCREDLAEIAVAKQMDIEDQIPIIKKAMKDQQAKTKEFKGYIKTLRAKQRDMINELQQFKAADVEIESTAQDTGASSTVELHELARKHRIKGRIASIKARVSMNETEVVSLGFFIGSIAVITFGSLSKDCPAEAKVLDKFGKTHRIMIEHL